MSFLRQDHARFTQWNGLYIPDDCVPKPRPKAVDLFAGCGGMSLGLIRGGFEVVAMVEWDPMAITTYMCNLCRWGEVQMHFLSDRDELRMESALQKEFKRVEAAKKRSEKVLEFPLAGTGHISHNPDLPHVSHIIMGDIRLLTSKQLLEWIGMEVGELDLISGSPPCQGFSTANMNNAKNNFGDLRNDLCFEMARLIVECKPKTMVLENVPPFGKSPQGRRFIQILKDGNFRGVEALEKSLSITKGIPAYREPLNQGHVKKVKAIKPKKEEQLELA